MLNYILTNESLVVTTKDGKQHTVKKGTPNFTILRDALLAENFKAAEEALTVKQVLKAWSYGKFTVENGQVTYKGLTPVPPTLAQRILDTVTANGNPENLCKFWERLQLNPSYRSVNQLWAFLSHGGIPIDENGCLLAYKGIKSDWTDVYSGKIPNKVGSVHEMPRNQISDDPKEACHFGFHVGALKYARDFTPSDGHMVICAVAPEDVVCVPYDESAQKMRVCKYTVVGVHGGTIMPSTTVSLKDDIGSEATLAPTPDAAKFTPSFLPKTKKKAAPTDKPLPPAKEPVAATPTNFAAMTAVELMAQATDALRGYAAKELKIIGASKIAGGKVPLIAKIMEARDQANH